MPRLIAHLALFAALLGGCARTTLLEAPRASLTHNARAVGPLAADAPVRQVRTAPPSSRFLYLGEVRIPTLTANGCDAECRAERARTLGASHVQVMAPRVSAVRMRQAGDWQTPALEGRVRGHVTVMRLYREARTAREAGLIHCVHRPACAREGRCSYAQGQCRALSAQDCRHVAACRSGRCRYARGACWVTRPVGQAFAGR